MSTNFQPGEGFIRRLQSLSNRCSYPCSNHPLVAVSIPIKPLDELETIVLGGDLQALRGFEVKLTRGPDGHRALVGAFVFPRRLIQPHPVPGLEAVNAFHRFG